MEPNQINPQNRDSKRSASLIMIVSAIIIILLIVWLVIRKTPDTVDNTTDTTQNATSTVSGASTSTIPLPKTVTVTLSDSGYTPSTVSIFVGDTVKFVNNSSGRMWTASGPHPEHTDYPAFDQKSAAVTGESYSFTFTKTGTWKYHNHLKSSQFGTVIVEQYIGGKE